MKMMMQDIFLSHSGKQKGFAKDLEARLSCEGYTVFFDQNYDSLPPGEDFPSHIFSAAQTCRLALVLISEDFVISPWPLMELCSFVDRLPSQSPPPVFSSTGTILPLFFKLSPADLKDEENVRKWRNIWNKFEFERENSRISAAKCEEAVRKVLPRLNGVIRRCESEQGEGSYINDIIERIYQIVLPRNASLHRYGADPDNYVGLERLSQRILDNFVVLEDPYSQTKSTDGCILGMYGVSGSGKSTLCHFLSNAMFRDFMGKVIHLELPTELRGDDDDSHVKEQYAKLLSTITPHRRDAFASMNLLQLYNQLLQTGAQFNHKMFLILDNISKSNYKSYESMLKAILKSAVLASGSRIMLVAISRAILENLLKEAKHRCRYAIVEIPRLTREEAMEVIRHNCNSSVEEFEDVIHNLLDKCNFPSSSFICVPFVFEQIGILLRNKEQNGTECLEQLELLCKTVAKKEKNDSDCLEQPELLEMVDECKKEAIQKLLEMNLKRVPEDLQVILFDIALFIIPVGYSKLDDAIPILCSMNDVTDIEMKIKDLMEHRALSVTGDGELRVHDIYVHYARSIPRNSKFYVEEPPFNISDASTMLPIRIHLKYSQARTIYIGSLRSSPHHHYDEACPHVKVGARNQALEVRLDVEVGPTTGALFVKKPCPYCKCMLGLSGDLSSLVCFRTENVRLVAFSPSGYDVDLSKLLRLELKNESIAQDIQMRACSGHKRKRVSMLLDFMGTQIQNTTQSMKRWLWKPLLPYEQWPVLDDQPMSNFLFCRRMSQLRVLILNNAGIRRLENIGVYCPQLEVLEVLDDAQFVIDLCVGSAPKLKRFVAGENTEICGSHITPPWHHCATSGIYYKRFTKLRPRNSRRLTLHLGECPELEQVYVDGSFDQVKVVGLLPSSLRNVAVDSDRCLQSMPGELVTSSIHTHRLSLLETLRLSCKVVKTLNFKRASLGCLPSLKELDLKWCESLMHLSVESSCMPNLIRLKVESCDKLEEIEGVEHLLMQQLKSLMLSSLPRLQVECDVGQITTRTFTRSPQLNYVSVNGCPRMKIDWNGLMMMQASESMYSLLLNEAGLCKWQSDDEDDEEEEEEEMCAKADESKSSKCAVPLDRLTFLEGRFALLRQLELRRVSHLREIEGFQHIAYAI